MRRGKLTRRDLRIEWRDAIIFEGITTDCHLDRQNCVILLRRGMPRDRIGDAIGVAIALYESGSVRMARRKISRTHPNSVCLESYDGDSVVLLPIGHGMLSRRLLSVEA